MTIADFVADLRAPTPSAAAEMVVAKTEFAAALIDFGTGWGARTRPYPDAQPPLCVLEPAGRTAGIPGRVAMRGRQVADLARAAAPRRAHARLVARARDPGQRRQRLEALMRSSGDRLAVIRVRLSERRRTTGGALRSPRRRHHADSAPALNVRRPARKR